MTVDPWSGFNRGVSALNDTFTDIRKENRQSGIDAQNAASARQQLAMGGIALDKAQRGEQDTQDLRAQLAGLQPITKTTMVEQMGPSQGVPNPSAPTDRAALAGQIQNMKAQQYDPSKSFGDQDVMPGVTNATPEAWAAQQQQIAPLQAQLDQPAMVEGASLPRVATTETMPVTDSDRMVAMIHHYIKTGDTEKAMALQSSIIAHANQVATLTGNPNDGLAIVNHATGQNLRYSPTPSLDAITNDGQLVGYLDKNKYKELTSPKPDGTPGMPSMDAMKIATIPIDLGGGGKAVMEFLHTHPNASTEEVWGAMSKAGVPLDKATKLLAEISNANAKKGQDSIDMGDRVKIIPRDGSAPYYEKKGITPGAQAKINLTVNASGKNEVEADRDAILNHELAPSALGKRNGHDAKVRAAVRAVQPGFNFTEADANAKYAQNVGINKQIVNLEAVKGPIKELAVLGKDLDGSQVKFYNNWKNVINSNTGDTKIIAYRSMRNSVIQELANAMRGAGISEGSIQLEMNNFNDAYSPQQIQTAADNTTKVIEAKQKALRTQPFPAKGQGRATTTKGGFKVTVVQ